MAIAFSNATTANPAGDQTSMSISYPTGISAGNLLVAQCLYQEGAGDPDWQTPSGWTKDTGTFANGHAVFWKIATGSESGSETFTKNGSGRKIMGGMMLFTGTAGASPVNNQGRSTSGTVSSITPSVADTLWLFFASRWNDSSTFGSYAMVTSNPTPWTEAYEVTSSGQCTCSAAYSVVRPQTTGSGNITASGTITGSIVFALAPQTSAIKTVDGLDKSSVKTVDGLAIASVKTINGLA